MYEKYIVTPMNVANHPILFTIFSFIFFLIILIILRAETARFETYSFSIFIGYFIIIFAKDTRGASNKAREHPMTLLKFTPAETARFELARAFTLLAFQASALDHYATSPVLCHSRAGGNPVLMQFNTRFTPARE